MMVIIISEPQEFTLFDVLTYCCYTLHSFFLLRASLVIMSQSVTTPSHNNVIIGKD